MHRRSITAATVAAGTMLATAVAAAGSASATPSSTTVPNTKPTWTARAQHLGHASKANKVEARVYLAPRGGLAALKQAAAAASRSHHFLTTAQYEQRFGVRQNRVDAVSKYLRSAGLHVDRVGANNRYVVVSGTVSAAEKAFGTSIDRYRHLGQSVQAPTSNVKVPSSLGSSVLTVTGLDTTTRKLAPASKQQAPPPAGFRNARPCSRTYGQVQAKYQADFKTPLPQFMGKTIPYAVCGYTGPQYRSAYEGNSSLDGSGVTVAITDAYAAPTIASDANRYAEAHGDGSYAAGQFFQSRAAKFKHQKDCGPSGWYGEETLDVEAVHAMAPGARIHYYGAARCYDSDFLDTLAQVVHDNDSKLVSNSWGEAEQYESADAVNAYEAVFLQGAMQGISFMYSSGDSGDELANTAIKQTDYPTSDPYVTSVGGTSDAIGATGSFLFQTGWGTEKYTLSTDGKSWTPNGFIYGAGGGASGLFNKPGYQNGVAPGGARQVPDMAMDADPTTGMLIGETQTFSDGVYYDEYRIGGTSLASPLFAGMTALKVQASKHAYGLLNPTIYSERNTAFTDIARPGKDAGNVRVDYVNGENASDGLRYTVRTFDQDSSLTVHKGYDNVTGVGAANPGWLTPAAS